MKNGTLLDKCDNIADPKQGSERWVIALSLQPFA